MRKQVPRNKLVNLDARRRIRREPVSLAGSVGWVFTLEYRVGRHPLHRFAFLGGPAWIWRPATCWVSTPFEPPHGNGHYAGAGPWPADFGQLVSDLEAAAHERRRRGPRPVPVPKVPFVPYRPAAEESPETTQVGSPAMAQARRHQEAPDVRAVPFHHVGNTAGVLLTKPIFQPMEASTPPNNVSPYQDVINSYSAIRAANANMNSVLDQCDANIRATLQQNEVLIAEARRQVLNAPADYSIRHQRAGADGSASEPAVSTGPIAPTVPTAPAAEPTDFTAQANAPQPAVANNENGGQANPLLYYDRPGNGQMATTVSN